MKKRLGSNLISVSLFLFSCSLISASAAQAAQPCSGWREDFNTGQLNRSRWTIGTGQAPGYIPNQHLGNYLRSNVSLSGGVLTLALTQQVGTVDGNPSGVLSHGGIIYTN